MQDFKNAEKTTNESLITGYLNRQELVQYQGHGIIAKKSRISNKTMLELKPSQLAQ